MLAELQTRFDRVEAQKELFLTRVRALPESTRATGPSPKDWSALQVANHLLFAEEEAVAEIVVGTAAAAVQPKLFAPLLIPLFCGVMRAAIPIPPPPGTGQPVPDPIEDTAEKWDEVRRTLRERLDRVQDAGAVFAVNPILGPLTARQVLDIMAAHLTYHLKRFPQPGG